MHSLLDPQVQYAYRGAPGNYFLVNGQYQPAITVRPGELVRLRLVNAGEDRLAWGVCSEAWWVGCRGRWKCRSRVGRALRMSLGPRPT
jgi:hypothetical protein